MYSRIFLNAEHVALLTASAAVLNVPRSAIKATNANWRKLHQQLIAIAGKNASASQQLLVIKATDMMYCQNWLAKPLIWSKIQIRAVKISSYFWFKLLVDNSTNKETDTGPLRGKYLNFDFWSQDPYNLKMGDCLLQQSAKICYICLIWVLKCIRWIF